MFRLNCSYVSKTYLRILDVEHRPIGCLCELVDLAMPDTLMSGGFHTDAEASDACKKVEESHGDHSWGSSHMTASAYCRVVISPYRSMPKCSNTSESVLPLSCAKPCRFFACVFVIVLSSS